ncbi:hypothetical protein ACLMAL_34675 [Nocardia sp. CWNU-33]|uniref:hypothetical protein n=1 Tax=Nocardia sp. CWNU-33 TaxID=3392117 RepID=UPI00398F4F67
MFKVDRILGDRPFAEVGDPALTVDDERQHLLAVAGTHEPGGAPVGVYGSNSLTCRALLRARYPVHAMAFHPSLPLLAVGSGRYDGGYFFEGELLLLDLETGVAKPLIEHDLGRQVLGLEWIDEHELRVLMAPPDDWQDKNAWVEGHVAVVHRPDWRSVPPSSITGYDLAGPRVPLPRPDGQEEARRRISDLSTSWDPRRNIRAIEELSDGRIITALDGVGLESWLPSGQKQWTVQDDKGGRDIVVATDERSAWIALARPGWEKQPQSVVRLSLEDGAQLDHLSPPLRCLWCDALTACRPWPRRIQLRTEQAPYPPRQPNLLLRHPAQGRRVAHRSSRSVAGHSRFGRDVGGRISACAEDDGLHTSVPLLVGTG